MANLSTITGLSNLGSGRNILQPIKVATTTETVFTMSTDTTGTTVPAVVSIPTQSGIIGSGTGLTPGSNASILVPNFGAFAQVPNNTMRPNFSSDSFNGRSFKVRLQGTFTSGVATNDLQIGLYLGTSATLGSDHAITNINTGTSGAFGAVSGHFLLETNLIWDVTTGKVDGVILDGLIGASGVAGTIAAQAATTQVSAAAAANLQFVASGKWNALNANNVITLTEFSIDLN